MNMLKRRLKESALAMLLGVASVAGGAGCDSTKAIVAGTGGAMGLGGGTGLGGDAGAGGSTTGGGGAGGAGIALVDWVTDLTDHHTDEVSPPDTVADKNIIDTDSPGAFDPLLAR
jgi:hypothetical protein